MHGDKFKKKIILLVCKTFIIIPSLHNNVANHIIV